MIYRFVRDVAGNVTDTFQNRLVLDSYDGAVRDVAQLLVEELNRLHAESIKLHEAVAVYAQAQQKQSMASYQYNRGHWGRAGKDPEKDLVESADLTQAREKVYHAAGILVRLGLPKELEVSKALEPHFHGPPEGEML